jgi:oxygen-independent coproporphyrinogen-3 oxidase
VYLHVPFCRSRCSYCDFNVFVGADDALRQDYVEALLADLERLAAGGPAGVSPPGADPGATWAEFGSVFVGGGTPTQLPARDLARVLSAVRDRLPVAPDAGEQDVTGMPSQVTGPSTAVAES